MARNKISDEDKQRALEIGSNLSVILSKQNINKKEFAFKLDVPYTTALDYLSGKTLMPVGLIQKASIILGVMKKDIDSTFNEDTIPKNIFTKFKTMTHTVPVYGRIPAGLPFEAIQDCLGDVAVPDKIARKHDLFGLKIVGDSMNKKIPNGAIGVFQKCCEVNQGVIAAIMVNGDDATVKHFTKTFNGCILEPDSSDPTYKERFIGEDEEDVRIIGKLVWFCMDPNEIK